MPYEEVTIIWIIIIGVIVYRGAVNPFSTDFQ